MKEQQEHHTDRKKLTKGVKYLAGSIPLAFLGPAMVYNAYGQNQDKPLFIPVMIVAFLLIIASVYCMFKGIRTIMSAVFND